MKTWMWLMSVVLFVGCAIGEVDLPVRDAGRSTNARDASSAVSLPDVVPARDVVVRSDASDVHDVAVPVTDAGRTRESCNGLDDDGNGSIDEAFVCALGVRGGECVTSCGSVGFRVCVAPGCTWASYCSTYIETCDNAIDDNCDGRIDCADDECRGVPSCVVTPTSVLRYEFQVDPAAGWGATEPYRLRDRWWTPLVCRNTGSTVMETTTDGWHRCETTLVSPFDGSFFTSTHPDWGDAGSIGTIGNAPTRCFPAAGVSWRITDVASGRLLYFGPSSGLPCVAVDDQDRHELP